MNRRSQVESCTVTNYAQTAPKEIHHGRRIMTHRETFLAAGRTVVRNPVGAATGSALFALSGLPVFLAVPFGPVAILGGLWATCLLAGVGFVALLRFATIATERGASVSVGQHFVETVKRPSLGFKLGGLTFVIVVIVLATVGNAPQTVRATVGGIGGFVLLIWYVIVSFASPELVDGVQLLAALQAGALRAASAPVAVIVFAVSSAVIAVVAGITVITAVLLLPAALAILAVQVSTDIEQST